MWRASLLAATLVLGQASTAEIQRDQLLKDVAQLRADLIAAEARWHVCEATSEQRQHQIESMLLTERVEASITELRRANPGTEFTWDQTKLQIVKVAPKEKTE